VAVCCDGRHLKSGDVWIEPRWKTASRVSWSERLFGPHTVVEIIQAGKIRDDNGSSSGRV
jgi:hypothetical protein